MRQTKGKLVYNPTAKRGGALRSHGGALRPGGALTSGGFKVPQFVKDQGKKLVADVLLPIAMKEGEKLIKSKLGAGKRGAKKKTCRC